MIAALNNTNMEYVRWGLRGVQFICSLFALSFAAAGFYDGGSTHSTTFVLLMCYTGFLYTLWHIACVEISHFVNRPTLRVEQTIDLTLVVMLLIAGICLASADYVQHCGGGYHCHNLKAAVAFDFLAMFAFLGSIGLSFLAPSDAAPTRTPVQVEEPVPYHRGATPTGALSPIGGAAAKV